MNRRDYDTLVRFVNNLPPDGRYTRDFIIDRLAGELAQDNGNFDYDRFAEATRHSSYTRQKPSAVRDGVRMGAKPPKKVTER